MIKDRILWLLWLVCMAGAAVITGTWLFAAVLLLTILILILSEILADVAEPKVEG